MSILFGSIGYGQAVLFSTDVGSGPGLSVGYQRSVAAVGDVNGDGIPDLWVDRKAEGWDDNHFADIYSGLDGSLIHSIQMQSPGSSFDTLVATALSISGVGDINQDGYDDILVGLNGWNLPGTGSDPGTASVFSGADLTILHNSIGDGDRDYYGHSVAGLGDVNGDGIPDFAVGAPERGYFGPVVGQWCWAGYLGPGYVKVWSGADNSLLFTLTGANNRDHFGYQVVGPGDLNNDGIPDIVVGAPHLSHTCIYGTTGPLPAGPGSVDAFSGADGASLWQMAGHDPEQQLGSVIDFGQSYAEIKSKIAIGTFADDDHSVFVLDSKGATVHEIPALLPTDTKFGWEVGDAGDLNDDGLEDFFVFVGSNGLRAYSGLDGNILLDGIPGQVATHIWDVNGDGYDDFAVIDKTTLTVYSGNICGDCNGNGVSDCKDIAGGASIDIDQNGVPDECEGPWFDLGNGLAGTNGVPQLSGSGDLQPNTAYTITLTGAKENALAFLVVGYSLLNAPFKGGIFVPDPAPPGFILSSSTDSSGKISLSGTWPASLPGGAPAAFAQFWIVDPAAPLGVAASNGLQATSP